MSVVQVGTLYTFSPNTPALSSQVNSNFEQLKSAFNALVPGADQLASGLTLLARAGLSASSYPLVSLARVQYPLLGNTAGGADTDVDTYALPPAAVNARAKGIRVFAWGTFAANGNSKTVKFTIGTQQAAPINGDATSNALWTIEGLFQRGASATATDGYMIAMINGTLKTPQRVNLSTASWDAGFNLKWTLASAGASDIVLNGCTYEYLGT